MDSELLYEKILSENENKGTQLRLVLSRFREVEYIHIRNYYMSYDEGYLPSKDGVSMPATISSIYALLDGLIEICAKAENEYSITKHFEDKIRELREQQNQ